MHCGRALLVLFVAFHALADEPLSQAEAEAAMKQIWSAFIEEQRPFRAEELEGMTLRHEDYQLRLLRRDFGEAPTDGCSLWISLHGGGGTSAEVNDQQWRNQIRLYEPHEGIYLAPRAPTNTWNLWHRPEVDRLLERLIESAIIAWNVNPDRVYLLGYSAGGDGVYQLAPRMADRFAAASMMAGHPNDATPKGLRNLPFAIFMGELDGAYRRNEVAAEWGEQLATLREADPEGYPHRVTIYPELGHWMQRRDVEAIPWMSDFTRNAWPSRVVWRQGNVPHTRFYWLCVEESQAKAGVVISATVTGQRIEIESKDVRRLELLLNDRLVNLDEPIQVTINGTIVFEGHAMRTASAIRRSLATRADPVSLATSRLVVELVEEQGAH